MNRPTVAALLTFALTCGVLALHLAPAPSGAVFTSTQPNASALTADTMQPATGLVAAQSANPGEIDLTWNASASVYTAGYAVYRATASGGPYALVASVAGNAYPDPGLTTGVTYYYVVQATYQSWTSAYSNESFIDAP